LRERKLELAGADAALDLPACEWWQLSGVLKGSSLRNDHANGSGSLLLDDAGCLSLKAVLEPHDAAAAVGNCLVLHGLQVQLPRVSAGSF
jgi:hypothetical protein